MALLRVSEVSKYFEKGKAAVDRISIELEEGCFCVLLGENGAGKSTLLSMLATVQKPDQGQILFRDTDISKNPGKIRACMGYVPQEIALYQGLTGRDNLSFFAEAYHIPGRQRKERIQSAAEMIGFSGEELDKKVKNYSGGMKRRLNMGAALLHRPELLLLDEPMAGVDAKAREKLIAVLSRFREQRMTVVMVEHELSGMEELFTDMVWLKEGRLVQHLNRSGEDRRKPFGTTINGEKG